MKRDPDPLRLDVASLIVEGGRLAGAWSGHSLDRWAELQTPPQDMSLGAVDWQAEGQRVNAPGDEQSWLSLHAQTSAWLTCQRCLQPWQLPLTVDARIRFVRGEAEAEALDAELEEDVLAMPRWLNLRELIEDELLLALPLVPRHSHCPNPLPMSVGEEALQPEATQEAHPFAALQALKLGKPGE